MTPDNRVPDDALVLETEEVLHLDEGLVTLQVTHDKLDGSPAVLVKLADPHPGPAVFHGSPPSPRRPHRAG